MKDTPKQEQLKIITDDGIILTPTEKSSTKTWHQLSGAVYIKKYLGVKDEDIISAVRYHTTGRENMTLARKGGLHSRLYLGGQKISGSRAYA